MAGLRYSSPDISAQCLHRETVGADAPLIAVNAASLLESPIDAEPCGYEKGAFTGALRKHRVKFEQAEGGTMFLDEIGGMPLALHGWQLRIVQDRKVTRPGSEQDLPSRVRLIFTTHQQLDEEVRAGRFRADLH